MFKKILPVIMLVFIASCGNTECNKGTNAAMQCKCEKCECKDCKKEKCECCKGKKGKQCHMKEHGGAKKDDAK